MGGLRDKAAAHRLQETLLFAKQVIVSYAGLLLTMDMFPQVSLWCCQNGPFSMKGLSLPCRQLKHEDRVSSGFDGIAC